MTSCLDRRTFLARSLVGGSALALAGVLGPGTAGAAPVVSDGPYGPLLPPNDLDLRLPEGFTARMVAAGNEPVAGLDYVWHIAADGGATFATDDGGWIYVSNCEAPIIGGVSALRFSARGEIVDAYRILDGTNANCAGGPTPWGTWLSCEEFDLHGESAALIERAGAIAGRVWECNPFAPSQGAERRALGLFQHEAAAVDPVNGWLYLTEDKGDGLFYRFRPDAYPDLSSGVLEAALVTDGDVTWVPVPDPAAVDTRTALQFAPGEVTTFRGGEGLWFHQGFVYFTTKGDNRVHALETGADRYEVIYDAADFDPAPLRGVDNLVVDDVSGDIFVGEDNGNMQLVMLSAEGEVAPFLQIVNDPRSEITGPAFSPDGTRLYFSSQRGGRLDLGYTYEVTGPFRGARPVALPDEPGTTSGTGDPTPVGPAPTAPRFTGGRARVPGDVAHAFRKVGPPAAGTAAPNGLPLGVAGVTGAVAAGAAALAALRNRAVTTAPADAGEGVDDTDD
jgi:uncharacterized protein